MNVKIKALDVAMVYILTGNFAEAYLEPHWNVCNGAFLQNKVTAKSIELFLQKRSFEFFDWVLNNPLFWAYSAN